MDRRRQSGPQSCPTPRIDSAKIEAVRELLEERFPALGGFVWVPEAERPRRELSLSSTNVNRTIVASMMVKGSVSREPGALHSGQRRLVAAVCSSVPPLQRILGLPKILGRFLCLLGIHDFRIVEVTYGFAPGSNVQRLQCKRCGQTATRTG